MKINQIILILTYTINTSLWASMENLSDKTPKPFPGIAMRTGQIVTPIDEQRVLRGVLMNEMRAAFQHLPEHIAKANKRNSIVDDDILSILPVSVRLALMPSTHANQFAIQPQLLNSIGFEVDEAPIARAKHLTNLGISIYQAPLLDESADNLAYKKMMVADSFIAASNVLENAADEIGEWDLAQRLDYYHSLGVLNYWAACNHLDKKELILKSQTYLGKAVNLIASNQSSVELRNQMLHVLRTAKIVKFYQGRLKVQSSLDSVPLKAL